MRCRCVIARFHLTGVLKSASRPCRPHFFVAPHPATPNNKKRLPFGNLLLLLERAMGFGPTTSTLATKKIIPKGLLLAFYHVNFTDIGMFSHIVDIINFGIGFSIFQTFAHYIFDNYTQYFYVSLQKGRIYPILSIFVQDFCLIIGDAFFNGFKQAFRTIHLDFQSF